MQNETEMQPDVALECLRASDIEPKEIKWLWYPYIPFGKVTILQGDPGDGKAFKRFYRFRACSSRDLSQTV